MIIDAKAVDHLVFGLTTAGEAHSMEPFDLDGGKERFGHCVVPTIAPAAHRASHAEGRELLLEVSAGVLAASVRMKDQAGCWPSADQAMRKALMTVTLSCARSLQSRQSGD